MKKLLTQIICNPRTSQLGFLALILAAVAWMIPALPTEGKAAITAVLIEFARRSFKADDPGPPPTPTP